MLCCLGKSGCGYYSVALSAGNNYHENGLICWSLPSNQSFYKKTWLPRGMGRLLMKESHGPTEQLQDLNWGAFDHASHAPHYKILQLLLGVLSAMNQYITLLSAVSVKHNLRGIF